MCSWIWLSLTLSGMPVRASHMSTWLVSGWIILCDGFLLSRLMQNGGLQTPLNSTTPGLHFLHHHSHHPIRCRKRSCGLQWGCGDQLKRTECIKMLNWESERNVWSKPAWGPHCKSAARFPSFAASSSSFLLERGARAQEAFIVPQNESKQEHRIMILMLSQWEQSVSLIKAYVWPRQMMQLSCPLDGWIRHLQKKPLVEWHFKTNMREFALLGNHFYFSMEHNREAAGVIPTLKPQMYLQLWWISCFFYRIFL